MNDYEKLEWVHFAIQEAQNGNLGELDQALELIEDIREKHMPTHSEEMQNELEPIDQEDK